RLAAVGNDLPRHDLEPAQKRLGLGASVRLDDAHHDVDPVAQALACGLQHRIGLADAGRRADEDLEAGPPPARHPPPERVRRGAAAWPFLAPPPVAAAAPPAGGTSSAGRDRPTWSAGPRGHRAGIASSARLSARMLTRSSPRNPHWRPSVLRATRASTVAGSSPRARATRPTCQRAAAGLTCGSSPLAEAVTRSAGMGARVPGSAALSASTRAFTASTSAGLSGPRFEPDEASALYANGAVADGRLQKYFGSSNGWPIRDDPATAPSRSTRLPFAWFGNTVCATTVTTSG